MTVDFLKNPWNSYSYEFVMFLAEFCIQLSEQPDYHFNMGREKFLSPIVQILGRPFSIVQIYRLFPYFVEKFSKGSLISEVISVTNGHAVMRLQFSESASAQFGPYLRGCAERVCHTTKATIAQVPATMFGRPAATIEDVCCIAEGAPYCEWTFTWTPQSTSHLKLDSRRGCPRPGDAWPDNDSCPSLSLVGPCGAVALADGDGAINADESGPIGRNSKNVATSFRNN